MSELNANSSIRRIKEMEERLNRLLKWLADDQPLTPDAQNDYTILNQYYSTMWREDFEADERGEFPTDLSRGVLSEDALYNTLKEFEESREEIKQMMEYDFKTNNEKIWLEDETGKQIALIEFPEVKPGVVNIVHTEVDPGLGGRGIAAELTKATAEKLRKEERKAVLSCSYAVKWFSKHPEYADVLDDPEAEAKKAEQLGGPACGLRK